MLTPANRRVPAVEGGLLGAHVLLGAALEALEALEALDTLVGATLVGAEVGTDVTGLEGVAIEALDEAGRHWK